MNALNNKYKEYLLKPGAPYKIPLIRVVEDIALDWPAKEDTLIGGNGNVSPGITWGQQRDIGIKSSNKTKENTIQIYQRATSISGVGRLRGNLQYLEDTWDVQIQPISFKYAYVAKGVLETIESKQSKIRDKYLKIRVRYDGTQYVMVNAIKTNYTISYA